LELIAQNLICVKKFKPVICIFTAGGIHAAIIQTKKGTKQERMFDPEKLSSIIYYLSSIIYHLKPIIFLKYVLTFYPLFLSIPIAIGTKPTLHEFQKS